MYEILEEAIRDAEKTNSAQVQRGLRTLTLTLIAQVQRGLQPAQQAQALRELDALAATAQDCREELSDDQNPESEILRHVASLEGRLEAVKLAMGLTDRGALQGCPRISRVGPQGRFTISAYAVPQDIAGHVVFCGPLEAEFELMLTGGQFSQYSYCTAAASGVIV